MYSCALELFEKGFSVTPVLNKRPLINGWQNIVGFAGKVENSIPDRIWQKCNGIGLQTGAASGVICLDIDIVNDSNGVLEELNKILPPIYCGLTGNKSKPPARLYKFNGERSEKFKFIDVELLCDGNQKVIPPSQHPDAGVVYEWVGRSLFDVEDADELPSLPVAVLEYLRSKNEELRNVSRSKGKEIELKSAAGRCKHGFHNFVSARAVHHFHQGMNFEDIVDSVMALDREVNCDPGDALYFLCASRTDFRSTVARVNAMQFVGEIIFRNASRRYDENDLFKEEVANGFTLVDEKNPKKYYRQYISLYNFLKVTSDVWYCSDARTFRVWDGKKYNIQYDDFIKRFAQKRFKQPSCTSINEKNTFLDYVKNEQQTFASDFNLSDKGLVNFKNGILNIYNGNLMKHDKAHKLSYVIDVPYGETKDAPLWENLLKLITIDRPHMALAIEEFIGYAISGCSYNKFNKLLILDGSGSNGKSTLIRIIQQLLGDENTSSVSLEAISKERFAAFNLVNKLANFCSEEPKEAFANTGAIKKITGGDSIMVEEKMKGAFQYHNIAKLIISYNKMPFFPDDSTGMRRRIILIPCEQNLESKPELKIKDVEARVYREERPQVLRRCVDAFRAVLERGHFTEVVEGNERVQDMITESNPVLSFIEDNINVTQDGTGFVASQELWNLFEKYNGPRHKYSANGFQKELKLQLTKLNNVQHKKNPRRGYSGIAVNAVH